LQRKAFFNIIKSNRIMKNLKRLFLLSFLALGLFSACKNDKKASTAAETAVTAPVKTAAELAEEAAAAEKAALESARLDSIASATAAKESAAKLKAEAAAAALAAKSGKKAATAPKVVAAKPKPKPKPKASTPPPPPPADINTQGEATVLGGGGLGGGLGVGSSENTNVLKRPGKDNVLTISEVKPAYPGGDKAMGAFLSKNIKYPSQAKEDGIKGTVYIKFVVEKDGSVADVVVSKGVHPLLDAEALRVVKAMPKWAAGKQSGQAVATQFTLPVKFQLAD
jgi:periplasmic protein TonB